MNLQKVRKVEMQPGYGDTVPANVRMANEKRKTFEADIADLELSIEMLEKLK
ncbi:hypothetical protein AcW1_003077 [Taiwanofungus camphoratus]|nr:hypothetical protein AcV5_001733 [Antrodia cinnamomea]KAI0942445.1 hypothetical protein AcW1_003077 [Antrodia cinnamomea]